MPKRNYRRKATKKQLTAIQLINQGLPMGEAMIRAGYSESTARSPKQALFMSSAILDVREKTKLELENAGLAIPFLVQQYKRFLTAQKTDNDDYAIQLKATKDLLELHGFKQEKKTEEPPKRQITITEWLKPPDNQTEPGYSDSNN